MEKLFLAILTLISLSVFSQSKTEIPVFASFSYYTPKMDTLFLQQNDIGSEHILKIWNIDVNITEKRPVIYMHPNINQLKALRFKNDWEL
jgi:hypothetical protein